ncbi:HNH endonuclease [Reichenbachiella sp. MALMAid0571]|uniref:HNH endonuclease n=1 Tax=Reichenbachiella sp. MALMAid0571 TaxID=3143939 RepID=UPI0032DE928D
MSILVDMQKGQRLWTREELILAINLYCKLPFGKLHKGNLEIIHLSNLIERTPSSVAYKLVNFASLDPSLQVRGIKGASNSSKLDKEIWDEFYLNWDEAAYESERLLAYFEKKSFDDLETEILLSQTEGKERESRIKVRVNQSFFRKTILASYNYKCCITGIDQPELLVAGHIKPWSLDEKNRLNPRNGFAMNNLHDKAFENGLFTISPDYRIIVSKELKKSKDKAIGEYFLQYDQKEIILPSKFLPDPEFLKYHNNERFRK